MSVPRFFDEDVFGAVLEAEKYSDNFEWLVNSPFVRMTDQGWVYHDVVRSLLSHYFRVRSEGKWIKAHKKLSKIYATKERELKKTSSLIEPKKKNKLKIDKLYHKICSGVTDKSIGDFLSEFFVDYLDASDFAPYYLQAISDAAQETENINLHEIAVRMKIIINKGEKQIKEVLDSIEFLIAKSASISPYALGKAYEISSDFCFAGGLKSDSAKYLSKAISFDPNDDKRYHDRSHMVEDDNVSMALDDINKAIELNPKESLYYRCRANLYLTQNRDEEAFNDVSKAIELNPNLAYGYHARAHYYERKEQYENALKDFTKAIELDPDSFTNFGCRGKLLSINLGEHQKAIDDFNKALLLDPKSGETFHQRGHAYARLQNYSEAISDIKRAMEYQPGFYYGCLADIYMQIKDYENVIDLTTSVIEEGNRFIDAYQSRARAKFYTKKFDDAISDYGEALKIAENQDVGLLFERGVIYIVDDKIDLAEKDFSSLLELLDSDEKEKTIYFISINYAGVGKTKYACKWLRTLFELSPKSISGIISDKSYDKIRDSDEFSQLETEYLNRDETSSDSNSTS